MWTPQRPLTKEEGDDMEIIKEYMKYLKTLNKSSKTIHNYNYYLIDFFRFLCALKNIKYVSYIVLLNVEKEDIIFYFYYLATEKNNKTAVRNLKLTMLRRFFVWVLRNNPEIDNPLEDIEAIRKVKRIPRVLNMEQIDKLMSLNVGNRNHLIFKIFIQTGIRLNELTNIKISKIDFSDRSMKVLGKGNKERTVYLSPNISESIKKYVKNSDREYLFEGKSNGHISNRTVQKIISEMYKKVGVEGYTVHSLRHTYATVLYDYTKDILLVEQALGHATLLSTQIYVHILALRVKEAVDKNPLNE